MSNCRRPAVGAPVETERVFGRSDVAIHALLSVVVLLSVLVFAGYWFSQGDWSRTPVVFTLMTVSLFAGLGAYGARWALMPLMRRPIHRQPSRGWRVGVATTFVPSAEPIEMLERSVAAMAALDYPHDTWVLDEGDDPEVRALCARLGVKHFSRHGVRAYQADSGRFESTSIRTTCRNRRSSLERSGTSMTSGSPMCKRHRCTTTNRRASSPEAPPRRPTPTTPRSR